MRAGFAVQLAGGFALLMAACSAARERAPDLRSPPTEAPKPKAPSAQQQLASGLRDLEASRYARAERQLRFALTDASTRPEAAAGLARILLLTGRYEQISKELGDLGRAPDAVLLAARCTEAEALRRLGRLDDAEKVLASVAGQKDAFGAQLLLGEVLLERGRRDEATRALMGLIEAYNDDRIGPDDATNLARVGRAAHLLRSPHDANDAFNQSEQAGPASVTTLLWRAELFLDKYDPGHAEEVLGEARAQSPGNPEVLVWTAQLKLAQALDFEAAERLAREALAVDPKLARAHFVLAGIALRDMDLAQAERHIDAGLEHNPRNLELLSLRATARFLADDAAGLERAEHEVLGQNPRYSGLYRIIGDYADWEHRYDDLVELMRKALRIDDRDVKARAQLGLNLIRAGRDAEGVAELQKAFDEDPFNVRVHNTLRLYEETIAQDYTSARHGPFRIRYQKDQQGVLERYVPELLDRAWARMTAEYGVVPETPLGVELYAEPESFAVRTSGLPRVPIQGVCFGRTLAVITPGQQPLNLGMTLWHELAHVFHIQLSRSRVPRWFTEGLAEDETTRARPEWRREHDLELYEALREARLPAIGDMNRAFTHAHDMDDMATAYYASGKVVQMLRERYGMARVVRMIGLWGQGLRTKEVVDKGLSVPFSELDSRFRAWLTKDLSRYTHQFIPPQARGSLQKAKRAATRSKEDAPAQAVWTLELLKAGKMQSAQKVASEARKRHPRSPDVLWASARVEAARERWTAAEGTLRRLLGLGHDGYAVRMALAQLSLASKDPASAVAALQAAHEFDTEQAEPIQKLVAIAIEREDEQEALRWLRKLAAIEQNDPGVYRALLRRLVASRLYEEACEVGEAAIYVDMMGLETHLLFAEALQARGSGTRALYELESAALCSGPPALVLEAHERLAAAYEARGDRRRAAMTRQKLEALGDN